jgi:hypothetical protein
LCRYAAPTTLAAELRKLFLVSDNEAFNRCYDIAGPAGINCWANNKNKSNGGGGSGDDDDDENDGDDDEEE